jgi:hypothetical protein
MYVFSIVKISPVHTIAILLLGVFCSRMPVLHRNRDSVMRLNAGQEGRGGRQGQRRRSEREGGGRDRGLTGMWGLGCHHSAFHWTLPPPPLHLCPAPPAALAPATATTAGSTTTIASTTIKHQHQHQQCSNSAWPPANFSSTSSAGVCLVCWCSVLSV